MGIRLSSSGGLTFSQKKGLDKAGQDKLLSKLSALSSNKPILEHVEEVKVARKKAAEERRTKVAQIEADIAKSKEDTTPKKSRG